METDATRSVALGVWSLLRRLPATLAGDEPIHRWRPSLLADGPVDQGDAWMLPTRVQYARGAAEG